MTTITRRTWLTTFVMGVLGAATRFKLQTRHQCLTMDMLHTAYDRVTVRAGYEPVSLCLQHSWRREYEQLVGWSANDQNADPILRFRNAIVIASRDVGTGSEFIAYAPTPNPRLTQVFYETIQ